MRNAVLLLTIVVVSGTAAFAGSPDQRPSVESSTFDSQGQSPSPQDSGTSPSSGDSGALHILWVPGYLWLTGLQGNIGVKRFVVPVDASFSDVFNNLNIGYMGALDLRKRRLGVLTDVAYTKLTTQEQSTPFGRLYSTARTRSKMFFIDPEIYGRLVDTRKLSVDAFAGVRVWRLDSGLDLRAGLLPALSLDATQRWADPLLGARFRVNLRKSIFVSLIGDAGVGPNQSWQIYTGAGKEFKQKYSLILAYRRLDVHYRTTSFLYDTSMNGILLGFAVRFR